MENKENKVRFILNDYFNSEDAVLEAVKYILKNTDDVVERGRLVSLIAEEIDITTL